MKLAEQTKPDSDLEIIAESFEIGQRVTWSVQGSGTRKGLFMRDLPNGFCEVQVYEWDGKKRMIAAEVPKELLKAETTTNDKADQIVEALKNKGYEAEAIRKATDRPGYWINVKIKEGRPVFRYCFFVPDSGEVIKFLGADKITGKIGLRKFSSECKVVINQIAEAGGFKI